MGIYPPKLERSWFWHITCLVFFYHCKQPLNHKKGEYVVFHTRSTLPSRTVQTHPNNGELVPLKTYPVGIRRPTISNGHGNCVSRESRKTSWFKSSPSDGLTLNAYLSPLKQTLPVFFGPPPQGKRGVLRSAVMHVQLLDLQPVLLTSAVRLWATYSF